MRNVLLYVLASLSTLRGGIDAHPLCYVDSKPPSTDTTLSFCDVYSDDGVCCNEMEEKNVQARFDAAAAEPLTGDCATLYQEMVCGICQSYSGHLYERLGGELGIEDGMSLKQSFCDDLVSACAGQVSFPDYDDGDSYCEKHALSDDSMWSHPIDPSVYETASTGLADAFPDLPGSELPGSLLSMSMTPDGNEWWLVAQDGQIWKIPAEGATSSTLVMDISSGFSLERSKEQGLLAIAFSPAFNSNNFFYVSFTISGDPEGANRLARFTYYSSSTTATADSMEILLTTKAKATSVHASGWVGFKPSDYNSPGSSFHDLYWSVGDGGPQEDTDGEGLNLDTLLASIVRISVPSSSTGSGYEIPSGNRVGGRGEICANGFRNPFRCGFDRVTDDLYCGDVGQIKVEEISQIQCGSDSDYGWSVMEGSRCQEAAQDRYGECADVDRSQYTFPIFEYCHFDYSDSESGEDEFTDGVDICGSRFVVGNAVIGGPVYRGEIYGEVLDGAVIFAEHETANIYFLIEDGGKWFPGTIIGDNSAKVISFAQDNRGEVYVITFQRRPYLLPCGDLCSTTCLDQTTTESVEIEYIGCFNDVMDDRALTLAASPKCDQGENAMSPLVCASYCATIDGAKLFGVQYGSECYCGSAGEEYDKHGSAPQSSCDALCVGSPSHTCGGFLTMEVYNLKMSDMTPTPVSIPPMPPTDSESPSTPAPVDAPVPAPTPTPYPYLGCYGDSRNERALTGDSLSESGMTTEVCANFCADSEYFGTQYSTQCFCSASGDDYDALGEATCDSECGGAPSEICGGFFALSVYAQEDAPTDDDTDGATDDITDDITDDGTDDGGLSYTAVGCFVDTKQARVLSSDFTESLTMTTDVCADFCSGFTNFGTEFGKQCFCGTASSSFAAANCDYPCAGDSSEICGGHDAINIYVYDGGDDDPGADDDRTFPGSYLGCYGDSESGRIMDNKVLSPDMTTQLCASLCEGFAYYGTQFGLECWCSDSDGYDTYGEVATCTMSCVGDSSQTCGGSNAMSVYMA